MEFEELHAQQQEKEVINRIDEFERKCLRFIAIWIVLELFDIITNIKTWFN